MSGVLLVRVRSWPLGGKAQGQPEGLCPALPVTSGALFLSWSISFLRKRSYWK